MRFENEFEVLGRPSEVIGRLDDMPMMASLLPGASVGPENPDGSFPGSLVVSFGPKKVVFKGVVTNRVDRESCSGVLTGRASADVRGAKMAVTMNYHLSERLGSKEPRTAVTFISEAQLTGVLAEFAKTGGVVVGNAIFAEFARRFSAQFADANPQLPQPVNQPGALSATAIAGGIFRELWAKLNKWVMRFFRGSRL